MFVFWLFGCACCWRRRRGWRCCETHNAHSTQPHPQQQRSNNNNNNNSVFVFYRRVDVVVVKLHAVGLALRLGRRRRAAQRVLQVVVGAGKAGKGRVEVVEPEVLVVLAGAAERDDKRALVLVFWGCFLVLCGWRGFGVSRRAPEKAALPDDDGDGGDQQRRAAKTQPNAPLTFGLTTRPSMPCVPFSTLLGTSCFQPLGYSNVYLAASLALPP